jgi:hypothetical protein
MSLLNSASLVVTPNAYKEGTLYSVIPNTTLGDMTVVRATTATRVNSAGLIELVPYNLLTYSEQLSNWTNINNVTVTENVETAPNGTLTASRINETAVTNVHRLFLNPTVSANKHTYSVYLKAGTRNWAFLRLDGLFTEQRTWFDIQNGTIGTTNGDHIASIENVGNGWYRCSVSIAGTTYDTTPLAILGLADANGVISYAGDVNKYIYAWGAQLVEGTLPKDYLRTETRLNIPRLDYSNGSCPSLLLEPQRTNLALRSEEFDNATWTTNGLNATVSANVTTSPDGTSSADAILTTITNGLHYIQQRTGSATAGTTYTMSIYVKKLGYDYCRIETSNTATAYAIFRFSTKELTIAGGQVVANSGKVTEMSDGWFRIQMSILPAASATWRWWVECLNDVGSQAFVGDITKGLYVWGFQFEVGSYATSYIATTSAAVTRNADVISKTGISDLIGQTEGTFYFNGNVFFNDATSRQISLSDGSSSTNKIALIYTPTSNQLQAFIRASGSISFNVSVILASAINETKIAIKYKQNDFALWVNGVEVSTGTSGNVPSLLNKLSFDDADGTNRFQGNVKSVQLYKEALTDAQCIELTTL